MPAILHLGTQPVDVGLDSSFRTTGAGWFDPTLDNSGCFLAATSETAHLHWGVAHAPAADPWVSYRFRRIHTASATSPVTGLDMTAFYAADGSKVGGIALYRPASGDGIRLRAFVLGDSGRVYSTETPDLGLQPTGWVDVNYKVDGLTAKVEFYFAGALLASATTTRASAPPSAVGVAGRFPGLFRPSGACENGFAHLAITDGISTVGRRFARLRPDAAGYANEWGGDVTALGDGSGATGISASGAGLNAAFTVAGPTITGGVAAVHVVVNGEASAALGQVTPFYREGGVNYYGSTLTMPSGKIGARVETFSLNPATGLAWVAGDFANEFGLRSGAAP